MKITVRPIRDTNDITLQCKSQYVCSKSVFGEICLIILRCCVALWANKYLILESKFYVHRTANTVHDLFTCRTTNCFDYQSCDSSTVPRYCYLDFPVTVFLNIFPRFPQFKLSLVTGNILLCSDWSL